MSSMMELVSKLTPLRMAPVSQGEADCVRIVAQEMKALKTRIYEFSSGDEHNGWVVPDKWEVQKAILSKNGKIIYDGMQHPLGVIGYSQSFSGKLSFAELKKHLFFDSSRPEVILYRCDLFYKVGKADWGFCLPYHLFQTLTEGEYEVDLQTSHTKGKMKVLETFLPGETDQTIILNAHNCHAAQANDGVSGIVVGMEIMKRLSLKPRHYSYKLIIAPEHLGTVFYLGRLSQRNSEKLRFCVFLEMLGSEGRFALQDTFTGESMLDHAAHHYLKHRHPDHFSDKFRKIIGNDETVWESAGFEIPTISLSRWPYPEYHSQFDDERIIRTEKMEESVHCVMGILNIMDTNSVMQRRFKGLIALSNPKYDLYINTWDPAIHQSVPAEQKSWNYLMDCLPRYFDKRTSVLDIARKHDLPYDLVLTYIRKFEQKKLISLRCMKGR